MNLNNNAVLNEIYRLLNGSNEVVNSNDALNVLLNAIENGNNSITKEDFYTTNNALTTSPYVASGGAISVVSESYNASNWNSSIKKVRRGYQNITISTTQSGRAVSRIGSGVGIIYLYSTGDTNGNKFYVDMELALDNCNINPAVDDVFVHWGCTRWMEQYPSSLSDGFYFRPPKTTESQFLKACIIQSGAENITDLTIPFDSQSNKFIKTRIYFDNDTHTLTFSATDGVNSDTHIQTNLNTLFSGVYNRGLQITFGLARNTTTQPTPSVRGMKVDRLELYTGSNF